MARPASSPPAPRVLLVEGRDDEYVVRRLFERPQSPLPFCILDKGGIDRLLSSIGPEIKVSGRLVVGILVDANDAVNARWRAVRNRLLKEGIEAPPQPDPAGTIIDTAGKPRVGIWLMPDNESLGELEDFVVKMIPDEDRVWSLAQRYIEGIPGPDRKFTEHKRLRAQLYAWLAAREDPRQMGLAIQAGDLKVDGDLSRRFVAWLAKLFA